MSNVESKAGNGQAKAVLARGEGIPLRAFPGAAATLLLAALLAPAAPAQAAPSLTAAPLTWNVIGLDSNNVNVGPDSFPVGARVCNVGDAAATNVVGTFRWDAASPWIKIHPGSLSVRTEPSLAAGACTDFYYEVEVVRDPAAYDKTARYHVEVTSDQTPVPVTTPRPRELYVERLVSQNRNSTTGFWFGTSPASLVPVPVGGTMPLVVGGEYYIRVDASTSTQGYEQIESFLHLPSTVFQILGVESTYSAETSPLMAPPYTSLYGDACGWVNDPNAPNYRACSGTGKAGGLVSVTYRVRILQVGASNPEQFEAMIYDFSGSSYHYNADYGPSARYAYIVDPTDVGFAKGFLPESITPGTTSTLTFRITNPTPAAITGVSFTDAFPAGLVVASPPAASTTGCGTPAFAPSAGAGTVSFSNGAVSGNGTCVVKVNVTAAASGTFPNTTGNLFVNGTTDTGKTASATLVASATPPCTTQAMATWSVPVGTTANPPDKAGGLPTFLAGNVLSAAALAAVPARTQITTGGGHLDTTAWQTYGYQAAGQHVSFSVDTRNHSQVSLSFWVANPSSANGPTQLVVSYGTGGTGGTFTPVLTINNPATAFTNHVVDLTGLTSTTGVTTIRLTGSGAKNDSSGASLDYDDVAFTGCSSLPATPPPSLSKAFGTDPITVGSVSRLTFNVSNAATTPVASKPLTGVAFSDTLPAGLLVATPPNAATTCTGGAVTAAAGSSTIALSGASMAAATSCTVAVDVVGAAPGSFENVSARVTSTESGPNPSADGVAIDTISVLAPPVLAKSFSETTVLTGATALLAFRVTNPNAGNALTGLAFTDTLPAGLTVATSSASACGGTIATTAPSTISFSGGSLAAASECVFSVVVTGTTVGTKNNVTGAVTSTEAGAGNAASATLYVRAAVPAIGILKQVAPAAGGPFTSFLSVAPGASVWYRITIENLGDVPLSPVAVADPDVSLAGCTWPATLEVPDAVDENHVASCVVGPVTAAAGFHTNTATASGTYSGNTVTATDAAVYATPGLTVEKSADEPLYNGAGVVLHYHYVVTNTGHVPLAGPVTAADDRVALAGGVVTCPAVNTVGDLDDYLDPADYPTPGTPAESLTCTADYTTTAFDVAAGSVTNTASASAGGTTSSPDSVTVPYVPVAPQADLAIAKTDGSSTYVPGAPISWTITVTNNGPATLASLFVVDPVPATILGPAFTPSEGLYDAPTGEWTEVDLAAGESITLTLAGTVASSATGDLTNTASVVVPVGTIDPVSANDSATDTDTTAPSADLSVTKTDGVATAVPGGPVTWTIVASNAGPSDAPGATVTDTFPASLTGVAWTCAGTGGGTCTAAGSGNIADTVNLPAGAAVTYTVSATVSPSATGSLANTATVTPPAGVPDPNPGDNSATDTDTLAPEADLAVSKTDGSAIYTPGGTVVYTIVVTNNGPSDVPGATVSDPLPAGIASASWSCAASAGSSCTAAGSGAIADTVSLRSGGTATYTSTLSVPAGFTGSLVNTVTASVPAGVTDPNPGNDSATDTDTLTASADLSVTKTDGSATYAPGAPAVYTIVVSNLGPSSIQGVAVSDPLPAGITTATWSCSASAGSACAASGTGAIADTVDLLAGGTATYTLTLTVPSGRTGTLVNTASASLPPGATDPNPGNESATDTDAPALRADLAVTKTDGSPTYLPGTPVVYTIVVTNDGPSDVAGATVSDPLPSGITTASWACSASAGSACTAGGSGAISDTVDLLAGGTATYTLTLTVPLSRTGDLVNTVAVAPPAGVTDPVPGNDSATDVDAQASQPDLSVTKTYDGGPVLPGGTIAWTISWSNDGTAAAGVTLTEHVPENTTFDAAASTAGWGCAHGAPAGTACTFTIGDAAAGAGGTVAFAATAVVPLPAGVVRFENTVSIADDGASGADPTPDNNSSAAAAPAVGAATDIPTASGLGLALLAALLALGAIRLLGGRPAA